MAPRRRTCGDIWLSSGTVEYMPTWIASAALRCGNGGESPGQYCARSLFGRVRRFQLVAGELTLRQGHPRINIHHSVLSLTGPPVLQEAAEECLKHSSCPAIFQHTR